VYVAQPYGQGIMPLTFAALKSQRFRWCFGGMQILRRHWRDLMPWNRDPDNHLTTGQRLDYLLSGLQWFNDLVNLAFSVVLLSMGAVFLTGGEVGLRPLDGAVVMLPVAIIASGLIRAMWSLRVRTGISVRRTLLAFANWLSLSWTVSLACVQGLLRAEGVFMRTPKTSEGHRLISALWSARAESLIAAVIWVTGGLVVASGNANAFVAVLFAWQGSVYACAPFMSWLNQHTELSAQLERRRRSEARRERLGPYYIGSAVTAFATVVLAVVMVSGGSQHGSVSRNPFELPKAPADDSGPITDLIGGDEPAEPTTTAVTTNTETTTPASSDAPATSTASSSTASSSTEAPTTSSSDTTPTTDATTVVSVP
jgi:hypothetical protein